MPNNIDNNENKRQRKGLLILFLFSQRIKIYWVLTLQVILYYEEFET